jgi:DNA-binding winged helix-turn-helix (wHTH) protein/tetratricopeptide (TPR) repeat protein
VSLTFDDFELDLDRFELRRDGAPISLEPQAFEVLTFLVNHRNRVVSKQELLEGVWGTTYVTDSALTTRIKEVRRALGDDGRTQRYVRTVRGRGYHFVVEATDTALTAAGTPAAAGVPGVAGVRSPAEPVAEPPTGTAQPSVGPTLVERSAADAFVGRASELSELRAAADEAIAGHGSIAMLAGEPGIGKTRMAEELEAYASQRGAQVLWGRAREASGTPPYHPWIQIGDAYGRSHDLVSLGLDLGPNARELVRLFPVLPSILPGLEAPDETVDPSSAQFRMFEAFLAFARSASAMQPLVLVLDDLHWADQPTLALLQHLAPELASMRLVVVGTYRDTEVDNAHPLSRALAQLNRERDFTRINLDGLSETEVGDFARQHGDALVPPALVQRVYARTEGNPFFVGQVLQLLTDDGLEAGDGTPEVVLPDGVREVLATRLERLSTEALALLHVGAVIGRQFEFNTLRRLIEEDDDALLELIEEALDARLIEDFERAGRYRFVHALMQETLLDELSAARQARTHGRVAEALEAGFGDRAEAQAPRLAHHFAESARLNSEHAGRTVHYSLLAAGQAEAQSAWDEAARLYERCIAFADEGSDVEIDLAVARLALGRCYHYGGAPRAAWRNLLTALDELRARGEWGLAAEAAGLAGAISAPPDRRVALISTVLEMGGTELSNGKRATLLTTRSMIRVNAGESPEATQGDADEAMALLGELELPGVEALLTRREAGKARRFARGATVYPLFALAAEQFDRAGNMEQACAAKFNGAEELLRVSPLDEIEERLADLLDYARRRRFTRWQHMARYAMARLAILQARPDDARRLVDDMEFPGQDSYYPATVRAALAELGPWPADLTDILPLPQTAGGEPFQVMAVHASRLRTFVLDGQLDEARAEWEQGYSFVTDDSHTPGGVHPTLMYASMGDAMPEVAPPERLDAILDYLTNGPTVVAGYAGNMDNVRGRIALKLGQLDEAERYLEPALEWTEAAGWPVDQGRVHQALAELAEQRGHTAEAAHHLEEAASRFREHGAQVFLQQLEAHAEA